MHIKSFRTATCWEIVQALRATNSQLDKVSILKDAIQMNPHFKTVLIATYDPFINYYIKKIPDYNAWNSPSNYSISTFVKDVQHNISGRKITGNAAKVYLSKCLERLHKDDAAVGELIIARDLKAGVSVGLINKASPGLIAEYPVMLCSKLTEKIKTKFKMPCYGQLKLDGMRVNIIVNEDRSVKLYTRNGLEFHAVPVFEKYIQEKFGHVNKAFVLDGEMVAVENDGSIMARKKSNGICNKAIKETISDLELAQLRYVAWDIVPYEEWKSGVSNIKYSQRFNDISSLFKEYSEENVDLEKIVCVQNIEINSWYDAQVMYDKVRKLGEEGIILKDPNGIWENARVQYQIKMKAEEVADLQVIGIQEGTGKYEGKLGAFILATSCGELEVSVGSGLSDEQRDLYFSPNMIGKIVAIKYNEIIESKGSTKKSLFLPIFDELRMDKTTANTLKELK